MRTNKNKITGTEKMFFRGFCSQRIFIFRPCIGSKYLLNVRFLCPSLLVSRMLNIAFQCTVVALDLKLWARGGASLKILWGQRTKRPFLRDLDLLEKIFQAKLVRSNNFLHNKNKRKLLQMGIYRDLKFRLSFPRQKIPPPTCCFRGKSSREIT